MVEKNFWLNFKEIIMQVQHAGAASAQLPAAQAQAVRALVNIQNAAGAAEDRVEQAYNATIGHMQEALKQSEANNVFLAERLGVAIERIETLAKKVDELEVLRRTEKTASEDRINALEVRLKANEETTKTLRANLDSAKTNFSHHQHVDGYTGSCHVTCATRTSLF